MDAVKLFHNCLYAEVTQKGYLPRRFTPKQIQYYEGKGQAQGQRAHCMAGVTMEFLLAGGRFSFSFELLQHSRDYFGFDIYEDGVFAQHIDYPNIIRKGEISYYTEKEEVWITVYLPYTAELVLSDIKGKLREKEPVSFRYLALGDSITEGMLSRSPSVTFPNLLARTLNAYLLNQGVGGYVFDENVIDREMEFRPDIITAAYGTNDLKRVEKIETIAENAACFMKCLAEQYPAAKIYIITPFWRTDLKEGDPLLDKEHEIRRILFDLSGEFGFRCLDGRSLMPHETRYLEDEKLHPNAQGFRMMANALEGQIVSR